MLGELRDLFDIFVIRGNEVIKRERQGRSYTGNGFALTVIEASTHIKIVRLVLPIVSMQLQASLNSERTPITLASELIGITAQLTLTHN